MLYNVPSSLPTWIVGTVAQDRPRGGGGEAAIRGSSEKSKDIDTSIVPKRRKSQSLNKVPLSIELGNTLHTYRVIF